MERYLDRASTAVMELSAALDKYEDAQKAISALSRYYGSDEWRQDFADDEAGLLPKDLKRGVLSEDGIWNLLSDLFNSFALSFQITPTTAFSGVGICLTTK